MSTIAELPSTRSGLRHYGLAMAVGVLLLVIVLLVLPNAARPLPASPLYLSVTYTLAFASLSLTAHLLYLQILFFRSFSILLIAAGFAYASMTMLLQAGIFLFGGAWGLDGAEIDAMLFWYWITLHILQGGAMLAVILYSSVAHRPIRQLRWLAVRLMGSILLLSLGHGLVVMAMVRQWPALLQQAQHGWPGQLACALAMTAYVGAAIAIVKSRRYRWLLYLGLLTLCLCNAVAIALSANGGSQYTLGWYVLCLLNLFSASVVLAVLLTQINKIYRDFAELNHDLVRLSDTDHLTGLFNRRYFDKRLDILMQRMPPGEVLSLVVIDIDFFKHYNDHYGHVAGDACLQVVAEEIRHAVRRDSDFCCRLGGEEFAVVLPATPLPGAESVAERIRQAVLTRRIPALHGKAEDGIVTISAGIAVASGQVGNRLDLLQKADAALYQAKSQGRNQVVGDLAMAALASMGASWS